MPPRETWPNLLQAASFILLDWRLWPSGASDLERAGIEENIEFLNQATSYFMPVFIFTNENPKDIRSGLSQEILKSRRFSYRIRLVGYQF